jgi:hypothetical protein
MKNHKNISKNLLTKIGAAGLICLMLSSCLKKDTAPPYNPPVALLAVIQGSPDEPPLNFFLNNDRVNLNPFNYGDNFDYFKVFAGKRTVNFYNAETMGTVFTDTVTFNQNTAYSLFLANTPAKPEMVLLTDSLSRPASGMGAVRFVNLSPDSPPVTLAIHGGAVLAGHVAYKGYTTFMPLQGKKGYTFEIRQGTTSTVLATLANVNLTDGYLYTIWFHGLTASTNSGDKLAADIITNAYYY